VFWHIGFVVLARLLEVPIGKFTITSDRCLLIPGAKIPGEANKTDIRIPLDDKAQTLVNWAKTVEGQAPFKHYPTGPFLELAVSAEDVRKNLLNKDLVQPVTSARERTRLAKLIRDFETLLKRNNAPLDDLQRMRQDIAKWENELNARIANVVTKLNETKNKGEATSDDLRLLGVYQSVVDTNSKYENLKQRLAPLVAGKICILGSAANQLGDAKQRPMYKEDWGPSVHSNLMNMVLCRKFLRPAPDWVVPMMIFVCAILTGIAATFLNPFVGGAISMALAGGYFAGTVFVMERSGICVPAPAPIIVIIFVFATITAYRQLVEEKTRKEYKKILKYYLTESVADKILKDASSIKLGGDAMEATVMFSDIANFTTLSERMSAPEVVRFLNEHFSAVTAVIIQNYGFLDKYIGDATMGAFGIPQPTGNHAVQACDAALGMMREVGKLRAKFRAEGRPDYNIRIGLSTGPLVAGNIGADIGKTKRFNFTVIGDTVNLGQRLEGLNKEYGTRILISEPTYNMAKEHFITREIGMVFVKGKEKPVRTFEVVGRIGDVDAQKLKLLDLYHKGLDAYRQEKWEEAKASFEQALAINPEDGPSEVYLDRCQENLAQLK
jgi:class 3 adenylate cyclase